MASVVEKNNGQTVFTFNPNNGIPVEFDLTGILSIKIECYGAGSLCGDKKTGSRGGYASGILNTENIQSLFLTVGCLPKGRSGGLGFGKGGDSRYPEFSKMMGYGGGGSTGISLKKNDKETAIMIAAGGGGGTDYRDHRGSIVYLEGYNGGGYSGEPISTANGNIDYDGADSWYRYGYAGQPGTQSKPGLGGSLDKFSTFTNTPESNGSPFNGGAGKRDSLTDKVHGGAPGGGAGWNGGGGGDIRGGGGSSFINGDPDCKLFNDRPRFTDTVTITGGNSNSFEGKVVITVLKSELEPKEFFCTISIAPNNAVLDIEIPFPYKQFTEMQFFISDNEGRLIPQAYYDRINERTIRIKNAVPFGITEEDDIKFTFCHNKGQYAVQKMDLHISGEDGIRKYDINSPYYAMLDLRTRFKVFLNRKALVQGKDYSINIYRGYIKFEDHIMINLRDDIDIICFYTGTKYNKAIPELPMSGYIYFNKYEIDRNLNKNLMAVFVNGKLVQRKDILDISNNIHKVSRDIRSRYNLEVLNLSPRVDSLVPRFKRPISRGIVKKKVTRWINGRILDYKGSELKKDLFEGPNGKGIKLYLKGNEIKPLFITGKNLKLFKQDFSTWLFDRGGKGISFEYLPKYKVTIEQSEHQTITVRYNGKDYTSGEIWVAHGDEITASIKAADGYNPGKLNLTKATITGPTTVSASKAIPKVYVNALIPWNANYSDLDSRENKLWKVKDVAIPDGVDRILVLYTWHYRSDEQWDQRQADKTYSIYKNDRAKLDQDIASNRLADMHGFGGRYNGTGIFDYNNMTKWFDHNKIKYIQSGWKVPPEAAIYGGTAYNVVGVTPGKTYKLACFSGAFKSRPYGFFLVYDDFVKNLPIDITDY